MLKLEFSKSPELFTWAECMHKPLRRLYAKGDTSLLNPNFKRLAIVGTRQPTSYGQKILELIVPELVRQNIIIVSGGALGIDKISQQIALDSGGKVITVLGSGLNNPAPASHLQFFDQVATHGLLLSEFEPNIPPQRFTFVQRNATISALAEAVLVIEAGPRSGSLITADFALQQGKTVLAVPGGIFSPQSIGTNQLIVQGALPVSSASDVLHTLKIHTFKAAPPKLTGQDFESRLLSIQQTMLGLES